MNKGAELLRATGLTVRHIAERLGLKAPSQVHRWLKCIELPSEKRRGDIAAAWPAVYPTSWDEPPGPTPPAPLQGPPVPPPAPAGRRAARRSILLRATAWRRAGSAAASVSLPGVAVVAPGGRQAGVLLDLRSLIAQGCAARASTGDARAWRHGHATCCSKAGP